MSVRLILFVLAFGGAVVGSLGNPTWGVIGYVGHYNLGPESQWWEQPIQGLGLRYSMTLAAVTAVGFLLNYRKLDFGRRVLTRQEWLMLVFLGWVWFVTVTTPATVGRYTTVDHPSMKFTKVLVFALLMTHIITTQKGLNRLYWMLVVGALILGVQAWEKPRGAFVRGRIEGVGGPDFSDANRLGGYLAAMLFIVAVQFMRSKWKGKVICFLAGGFAANALVLCRSRGAFLGMLGGGVVSAILAPKKHRAKIILGLVVAGAGVLYLSDPQFRERMTTIRTEGEERDSSAQSRVEIWKGGMAMVKDHPLGVGAGNFYQYIGRYAPGHAGRDAHNAFVRCAGELGIPGFLLYVAILGNAILMLRRVIIRARARPEAANLMWASYGALCGLVAMFTYGFTGSITYTEYGWWMLALPVCLQRVYETSFAEAEAEDTSPLREPETQKALTGGLTSL